MKFNAPITEEYWLGEPAVETDEPSSIKKNILRSLALFIFLGIAFFLTRERLVDVFASAPRVRQIPFMWLALVFICEFLSFASLWWLFKAVLPKVSWGVIIVSQLVSNAASRVIPGGAATGGAVQFHMMSAAGVKTSEAAGALGASTVLTMIALLAVPTFAGIASLFFEPLSGLFATAAITCGIVFAFFVLLLLMTVFSTKPLLWLGRGVDGVCDFFCRLLGKQWQRDENRLITERDRLGEVLESNWQGALLGSLGKWGFDCLVLIVIIRALDPEPRFGFILLAYSATAILTMIPLTPGGFGFVEVGLANMLESIGVASSSAELAVFVYRLVSFWFPIAAGLIAWGFYKRVNEAHLRITT